MGHRLFTQLQKSRQMAFWLRAGAIIACCGLLASALVFENARHEDALLEAEMRAETMARALAQHGADTFQIADIALTSVVRLIGAEIPTRDRLAAIREDMAEHLARTPRLSSLAYYEQAGWMLATTGPGEADHSNHSGSPIFEHHRNDPGAHLWIGPPTRLGTSGPWFLTASRRISDAEGGFGGIIVATIEARYFADFYTKFDELEGSRVILMGRDGVLLARNPHDPQQIGLDLSDTQIFQDIRTGSVSGTLRLTSRIDGVERLSAYRSVPGHALTLIFSVARSEAIADWREGLLGRSAVVVLLMLLVAFGGWRLADFIETRFASEASLLEIATTDALTGLPNRRAFDQISQREWRSCLASGRPLTFLMIDVDHFKAFNDNHGHQAGDECLRELAATIRDSIHHPLDLVTRYGGEEIAVVLPNTSCADAFAVADRIRRQVEMVNLPFLATPLPHVTVSIGYATRDRHSRTWSGHAQLLAAADRALYAAKVGGRNRIVSAVELPVVSAEPYMGTTFSNVA